jgi:BirA family biotin operon repressor/biotin-[acetyl-CoA-carboxylase] ligase
MKRRILEILKKNGEDFISGEDISKQIGVTRTAVWKHINQLKEEGYEIESISRKGYCLIKEPDMLYADLLEIDKRSIVFGKKIYHFESVESTNTIAKRLAAEGADEGTIIIAEEQTEGKGRLGRYWQSDKGAGIWMSIILKPKIEPSEATKITQIAAAAAAAVIRNCTGCKTEIKWPNDIILNKKKVCGILTEMSGELNSVNYVIVGIGINVKQKQEDFVPDFAKYATSIKSYTDKTISRKEIVIDMLEEFERLYLDFLYTGSIKKSLKVCKKYSATLGNKVRIIYREKEILAEAIDITEKGELLIKDDFGEIKKVISGEVSVRGLYGYI